MTARLENGGITDEVDVEGRLVTVRFVRCTAGWQASFELQPPGTDDLAVAHRLVAPSLADARVAVPRAIRYLLGCPLDEPLYDADEALRVELPKPEPTPTLRLV